MVILVLVGLGCDSLRSQLVKQEQFLKRVRAPDRRLGPIVVGVGSVRSEKIGDRGRAIFVIGSAGACHLSRIGVAREDPIGEAGVGLIEVL